jgi:hypothetical protein
MIAVDFIRDCISLGKNQRIPSYDGKAFELHGFQCSSEHPAGSRRHKIFQSYINTVALWQSKKALDLIQVDLHACRPLAAKSPLRQQTPVWIDLVSICFGDQGSYK